jgi:hypothetical protein
MARPRKTHCLRGHAFNEANTHVDSYGYRSCRTCLRERAREKYRAGKKQTRKTISVAGATYRRLRDVCAARGVSMSMFVERLIAPHIANVEDPGEQPRTRELRTEPASGYFTF